MHSISQCCCWAKAEQCCCYGCWVSLSARHYRLLFTDVLALKTACSCQGLSSQKWERELKASYWDRAAWWTSTPTEPVSPWNKLELLSSWAPTLQSPCCPTGACQPRVHTVGDKKDEGQEGQEKQTVGGVRMIHYQSFEGRGQLWHISTMKVNGTEDLQDNANGAETKAVTET